MITYKKGNLLDSNCDIICHQVNCQGVMGAGIAKQLRDRYSGLYDSYKCLVDIEGKENCLGEVFFFQSASGRIIANMFSQFHYLPRNVVNTDYEAFRKCCRKIKNFVLEEVQKRNCLLEEIKIGFPYKIGCGLAGGDWNTVLNILKEEFVLDDDYLNTAGNCWNVEIWEL